MIGRGPAAALAALALAAACDRAPSVRSCDDDLTGVWRGPAGAWQLVTTARGRELHPIERELPADLPPGVIAAPATIELPRAGAGAFVRRYERGARFCRMTGPARLTACGGGRLTLEVAPPPPPDDWDRCAGAAAASRPLTLTR